MSCSILTRRQDRPARDDDAHIFLKGPFPLSLLDVYKVHFQGERKQGGRRAKLVRGGIWTWSSAGTHGPHAATLSVFQLECGFPPPPPRTSQDEGWEDDALQRARELGLAPRSTAGRRVILGKLFNFSDLLFPSP